MLTNLLPGLRELRAPLSAGYLWIALIWLVLGPHIPPPSEAQGLTRRVLEFFQDVGAIGGGVALSFAAYLIGAVSQAMLDPLLRRIPTPGGAGIGGRAVLSVKGFRSVTLLVQERVAKIRADLKPHRLTLEEVARRELRSEDLANVGLTEEEVRAAENTRALMNARGIHDVDLLRLKILRRTLRPLGLTIEQALRLVDFKEQLARAGYTPDRILELFANEQQDKAADSTSGEEQAALIERLVASGRTRDEVVSALRRIQLLDDAEDVTSEALENGREILDKMKGTPLSAGSLDDLEYVGSRLTRLQESSEDSWEAGALVRRVIGDLDLVATRLIGNDPDLYSAVDRLRAEAEFRLAIVGPMIGLSLLLAQGWHGLWSVLVAPAVILLLDGKRRDRSAMDLLADALFLGRVEAPALEKFERSAQDLILSRTGEASQEDVTFVRQATVK